MGKERKVDGQVHGSGRLQCSPVDVDHIADGHEREERYGDGEGHVQEGQWTTKSYEVEEIVNIDSEEDVVLEPRQQPEQQRQGHPESQPLGIPLQSIAYAGAR